MTQTIDKTDILVPALKAANRQGDNGVFSPVSLKMCLGMLLDAAGEEWRRTKGFNVLNVRNLWDLSSLKFSNGIWHRPEFSPTDEFRSLADTKYRAPIAPFKGTPGDAADAINAWVEEKTDGMITKLVSAELIGQTLVLFVNTTLLKAEWEEKFDKRRTYADTFNGPRGASQTDFMHDSREDTPYAETDELQSIKLALSGKRVGQFILPAEGVGVESILDRLEEVRHLRHDEWYEVNMTLPRLSISAETDCGDLLGITAILVEAFGISGPVEIRQVARIELDEEGVRAAAATYAAVLESCIVGAVKQFVADRPFIFLTVEEDGTVSFAAVVNNPAK